MMRKQSIAVAGFTLIELLIVVAIVGILSAIAIPQFMRYRQMSYNATAVSDLRTTRALMESYFTESQRYPY